MKRKGKVLFLAVFPDRTADREHTAQGKEKEREEEDRWLVSQGQSRTNQPAGAFLLSVRSRPTLPGHSHLLYLRPTIFFLLYTEKASFLTCNFAFYL